MQVGAWLNKQGKCTFTVWAPFLKRIDVKILLPHGQRFPMEKDEKGYWSCIIGNIESGTSYLYLLNEEKTMPDPASQSQPQGVHGPSEVIDQCEFQWDDLDWKGIPIEETIFYEIHIGCFTPEGTFASAQDFVKHLSNLGVNAVEIMPVAAFPGERNWGYDGAYPFAVQNSYGGCNGFKTFVNLCHKSGIAVFLDVVYNHFGPEGSYFGEFGPYFSKKYSTLWGSPINFDGEYSNEVRNYFIENAIYWLRDFHIDGLRLDAIQAIYDFSARSFLSDLAKHVESFSRKNGRKRYLVAESDLNDARIVRPTSEFGTGLDGQWTDDFHHSLQSLLTKDVTRYYCDFGSIDHMALSFKNGFVYSGQYSQFRKKDHGNSTAQIPLFRFVVCSQNHDQIGNRMLGERLSSLVSFEALKLAASAVILSPFVPLLFMGEEYAENTPFLFFADHSDQTVVNAVRKAKAEEFSSGNPVNPFDRSTFLLSKLDWRKRSGINNGAILGMYKKLILLRKTCPPLSQFDRKRIRVTTFGNGRVVALDRSKENWRSVCFFNFTAEPLDLTMPYTGEWKEVFDSADTQWMGPGSRVPQTIVKGTVLSLHPWNAIMLLGEI